VIDVIKEKKNESGKTAAEVAANDEIRNLINRIKKL